MMENGDQILGMDKSFEHMSYKDCLKTIYWQGQYMLTHLQMVVDKVKSIRLEKVKELFLFQSMYADVSGCSESMINGISMNLMLLISLDLLAFIFGSIGSFALIGFAPISFIGSIFGLAFGTGVKIGIAGLGVWGISKFYRRWTTLVLKIVEALWLVSALLAIINLCRNLFSVFTIWSVFSLSIFGGFASLILIFINILFYASLMVAYGYLTACALDAKEIPDS